MDVEKITLNKKSITDFAAERNKLLAKAKTEWVLFVDLDEEISPELEREIREIGENQGYQGYRIKRRDWFMGRWLKYGETGNIKLLRLGKKGAGVWKRKVNEVWEIWNVGEFRGKLLHYPHKNIAEFIKKINFYSDLDIGEFGGFRGFGLIKPVAKFFLNYFLKLGFLDGFPGFVMAFMMSFQSLVVRVKQFEKK
ncbi:glycosyltransferase family 2 protein [Candidatus Gottesmanbacteria bacterium]|nr:glycosyltransferase family 2 protein [Candidatus Gottesmanbacteria bacterium]